MKNLKIISKMLLFIITVILTSNSFGQDPNFHIYLCFGQSNMEGSAAIEAQDTTADSRFKVMQSTDCSDLERAKGNWYKAVPPLSQCEAGLSPADYFGRTMVANLPDSITVGVINVAIGGCDIRLFDKDIYQDYDSMYGDWFTDKIKGYSGNPYVHLIKLAKIAQQDGVIKGILLHQGETNNGDEEWPFYVNTIYNNILADLSLKADFVPLLVGEVVGYDQNGVCADMNPIISKLPGVIPTAYVIPSRGCDVSLDNVHFNSNGVREIGKRYATKMLSLLDYKVEDIKVPLFKTNPIASLISAEALPNNKAAFRIYAPKANNVNLRSDDKWDRIDFKKDGNGVWEGIWSNVQPGAYRYRFVVDGLEIYDPKAESTRENTAIFMMTSGDEYFAMKKDVPHGAISQRYYYSNTIKEMRRMHVWTPAGFEKSNDQLPVLYLIHGGGDTDNAWSTIGCAGNILDNLLAEGKIEPMIVIMPNGSVKTEKLLDRVPIFTEDLMTSIIPFVESNYNVYTDQEHKAIMGLSMGGLETLEAVTNHCNDFGYVGVLSSGWWISDTWANKRGMIDNKEKRVTQLKKIATDFNKSVKMLYFTQGGSEDLAYENGMETLKLFDEAGIKYQYNESPGGHTWMVWRKNLMELTPLLFK